MAKYLKPVTHKVTNPFGADPAYYKQLGQNGHNGTDYASPVGTPVKASADGTVEFEGWGQNHYLMGQVAGICAIIKHKDVKTGYAHMSRTIVNKGQKVKQGQVIGYTGATGMATGPHLHFEFIAKKPNINNGYYGRLNPKNFDLGTTPDKKKPAPKPKQVIGKRLSASGTAKVKVDVLNIRRKASTKGKIDGRYKKGNTFNYDSYIIADGYVWLSYVSYGGLRQYVAEGPYDGKKSNTYVSGGVSR